MRAAHASIEVFKRRIEEVHTTATSYAEAAAKAQRCVVSQRYHRSVGYLAGSWLECTRWWW